MVDKPSCVFFCLSSYLIRLRAKASKWNKNNILSHNMWWDFFVSPSRHKCAIFSKALHLRRGDASIY